MNTINKIAVFDNDKCVLAMLRGYCYPNNFEMIEVDFNLDGINELIKLRPPLVIIPLDWISTANKSFEARLLRRESENGEFKICCLNNNTTHIISAGLAGWLDVIINNPLDIGEIDRYLKKTFIFNRHLFEKRKCRDRRTHTERRHIENTNAKCDKYTPGYTHDFGSSGTKDFYIDQRNKCLLLKGHRIDLTPKEFELVELLSREVDRIFKAEEIIEHLWPENKRASKSDLYQYMHLLRKKIEKDPNSPKWIMNVKGFGYKLNLGNFQEMYQGTSQFLEVTHL